MKRLHLIALGVCLIVIISAIMGSFLAKSHYDHFKATEEPTKDSLGICLHLEDYDASTEAALVDLGVRWVRIDWEIGKMASFMQEMDKHNVSVLAIIDHITMNWSTTFTLQDWQGNVSAIVASPEAKGVDAWEILNEPNGAIYVAPDSYYEMIKSSYTLLKNYSSANVVFAGVSPNVSQWQTYLSHVFAHKDIEQYFDIMGAHLYDDASTNNQTLQFVKGLTDKPIWVTEIGKPSASVDNTKSIQANYVVNNIPSLTHEVDKVFWYELRDCQKTQNPNEKYFGLIDTAYSRKPAYVEFKGVIEKLP